jgi:hypothetical protein
MRSRHELLVQLQNGQTWRATLLTDTAAGRAVEQIRAMCPDALIELKLYPKPAEFHTGFAAAIDFREWAKDAINAENPLDPDPS